MSVIEGLKADAQHRDDCRQIRIAGTLRADDYECDPDCDYRRKMAFLERLESPTDAMVLAGNTVAFETEGNGTATFKAMIEEAQK